MINATSAAPQTPADRVVIVGAGPAGMAAALELADYGIPSVVLEKRAGPATRENLFNVLPPFADRLAAMDPTNKLASLLTPTSKVVARDDVAGTVAERIPTTQGIAPDPGRSRGDIAALVHAMAPPSAPGADNRAWSKVGVGDLENGMRELARTRYPNLIEIRQGAVDGVTQGAGWAEAHVTGKEGATDAIRGAFLVDASGTDLLHSARTSFPEKLHWLGGRFAAPADGDTTVRRTTKVDPADKQLTTTIAVPGADRTIVWAHVNEDPASMSPEDRMKVVTDRAHEMGVEGDFSEGRRAMPATIQLTTTTEPARGRVLKVGDSNRSPYFPTSSGAAAAIIHDAPAVADAIAGAMTGDQPDAMVAGYAASVLAANEQLLTASRGLLLHDAGIPADQAGAGTVEAGAKPGEVSP